MNKSGEQSTALATWVGVGLTLTLILIGMWGNSTQNAAQAGTVAQELKDDREAFSQRMSVVEREITDERIDRQRALDQEKADRQKDVATLSLSIQTLWTSRVFGPPSSK